MRDSEYQRLFNDWWHSDFIVGSGDLCSHAGSFVSGTCEEFLGENGPLIILGLSFFGLLYSIYLSYLELFVIHAICPFCALSAVILLAMFVISVLRFQKTMEAV